MTLSLSLSLYVWDFLPPTLHSASNYSVVMSWGSGIRKKKRQALLFCWESLCYIPFHGMGNRHFWWLLTTRPPLLAVKQNGPFSSWWTPESFQKYLNLVVFLGIQVVHMKMHTTWLWHAPGVRPINYILYSCFANGACSRQHSAFRILQARDNTILCPCKLQGTHAKLKVFILYQHGQTYEFLQLTSIWQRIRSVLVQCQYPLLMNILISGWLLGDVLT